MSMMISSQSSNNALTTTLESLTSDNDKDLSINDKDHKLIVRVIDSPLSIDIIERDSHNNNLYNDESQGEDDIETQLQLLHEMILIRFEKLEELQKREFSDIRSLLNDSQLKSNPIISPIASDNRVPMKKSYFRSIIKSLKMYF